jgi:hypothetical protein
MAGKTSDDLVCVEHEHLHLAWRWGYHCIEVRFIVFAVQWIYTPIQVETNRIKNHRVHFQAAGV